MFKETNTLVWKNMFLMSEKKVAFLNHMKHWKIEKSWSNIFSPYTKSLQHFHAGFIVIFFHCSFFLISKTNKLTKHTELHFFTLNCTLWTGFNFRVCYFFLLEHLTSCGPETVFEEGIKIAHKKKPKNPQNTKKTSQTTRHTQKNPNPK